ncbi:uncharacterized protein LOC117643458 isoform X2 [Thrips palmi]|uniref:Uncharacterized protein LOC117643458 isoform X2 n=1 Tax=Thrips palmi TaxID=161013 RepID=A0A6P8YEW7_THRPL|nr:uncharacterized protein LOC117643458 isoform X2 [Thrips palmi]
MPTCKYHELSASQVYKSTAIAQILCQLSKCFGPQDLGSNLFQSCLESISHSDSQEKKQEAIGTCLCLIAGLPALTDVKDWCKRLFDLCKHQNVEIKLIYAALVSRCELSSVTCLLDYERPFLRDIERIGQDLAAEHEDIFMSLFLMTVRKQEHWLDVLLEKLYSLLGEDKRESVINVLSSQVLHPLWQFLFFRLAETLSNVAALKFAADQISENGESEPTAKFLAQKLLWQMNVINFAKDNSISCVVNTDLLFKTLSTLNLLHQCCYIWELDWQKTHEFLLKHSVDGGPVAMWEVTLFDAFYASSLAFQYVSDCLHSRHIKTETTMKKDFLSRVDMILCNIQPHSMRLTIMQNIFSLLFVRYEDFKEDICSDSEEGEIDANQSFQNDKNFMIDKVYEVLSSSLTSVTNTTETGLRPEFKRNISSNHSLSSLSHPKNWHESYQQKHGFVCDRFMTRDILKLLQGCIKKSGYMHITDQSNSKPELESSAVVQYEALQKKVEVALWKLDILLGSDFVESTVFSDTVVEKKSLPDWLFQHYADEDSASDEESHITVPTNIASKRADTEKSSSGSQSNLTSQGQILNTKWIRRGRRRSSTRLCVRSTKDTIIKRMLSSKVSFVSQCLSRGNFCAANKIIQTLNLQESEIAAEVNFIEVYRTVKLKVEGCLEQSNKSFDHLAVPKNQNSTLQVIQRAASAGVQSSLLNKELEKLLSSERLPRVLNVEHISEDYLQLFGGSVDEQPIVTAAVDIALMLSSSIRQAANFLNIAGKYSYELQNIHTAVATRQPPMGFLPFLQNILQATTSEPVSTLNLLHGWETPSFLTKCLRDTLHFWDSLNKLLEEVQVSNYVVSFPKLCQLTSSYMSSRVFETKVDFNYLQELKSYLRLLKSVVDRSPVSLSDVPLEEEHFMLLTMSPHKLIIDMVIDEGMPPQTIESLVSQLGCSLPHILSLELCSSLPSTPSTKSYLDITKSSHHGVHVLNVSDTIGPVRHPASFTEALLQSVHNELLRQLRRFQKIHQTQNGHIPCSLVNTKRLQLILAATWELRDVNLALLQPGAETLAFYCNLANLMWIHSVIYFSGMGKVGHACLKSFVCGNSAQQLAAMNLIAYQVGASGVLTFWEIRLLALGINSMRPVGTKALNQYATTTDSFDPLSLFVVTTGTKLSPKLKVMNSEKLEEQLQESVEEYLHHWADIQEGKVTVPYLVEQYIQSTGQNPQIFLRDSLNQSMQSKNYSLSDTPEVSYIFDEDTTCVFVLEYGTKSLRSIPPRKQANMSWKNNRNLYESILQYIRSHSPLASLLLKELSQDSSMSGNNSELDEEAQEATELISITSITDCPSLSQCPCLVRLCQTANVEIQSKFFDDNVLLCGLHSFVPHELLWERINDLATEQQWSTIVQLLRALPQMQLQGDPSLSVMLDLALLELAVECQGAGESWMFSEEIKSLCLRSKCVMSQSIFWPGDFCVVQLRKLVEVPELRLYPALFTKAEKLMHSIKVYQKVVDECKDSPWGTWQDVYNASQKKPSRVLDQILADQNAELCLSWIDLHNITSTHTYLIDSKVIVLLLNDSEDRLKFVEQLLKSVPSLKAAKICYEAIDLVHSLLALQFCAKYISLHCFLELSANEQASLEVVSMGIDMLKSVSTVVQDECIKLVRTPHLMIEQLVMNVQLDAAEKMLDAVRPRLLTLSPKSSLSVPALDSMLRQYAEKALEFRISQSSTASQMSESSGLLASLSLCSGGKDSVMPVVVPSKAEWVPNDKASVCMICQLSTFTMFNRRHHCRRCGLVVCAQCSPLKAIVQGYGTLKVRVCNSCFPNVTEANETLSSDQLTVENVDSNASVTADNVWRLSVSPTYNDTIRGEFAYENAPSVSLCLSILKIHSESAACPNFLIDSCETILGYLQPQEGMPNPEVDYVFVIEMCRSLVLAAKVKCAQWGYVSDEPNCDQRLSKIDLFGLLVSNGCTAIIPTETSIHGLRRLQSQLLEAELWDLALEVSTKSGMERIGVWTAWGKGCLRAGRWKEAREKFVHCFPSSNRINKSAPDSPLLLDILQILENTPHLADHNIARKAEPSHTSNNRFARSAAVTVLNTLASLKNTSQGKFSQTQGIRGSLQPVVYSECCYYLGEYGSHATYLQFLVQHSDFKATVDHTLSHSVDSQIFFEHVYMPCLRRGLITPLHSAMTAVDPSLAVWTTYLYGICAALERRKLLHTLYEVQQWSKDHVRSAMTCIRFYHLNAKSYMELATNINHLMRAQSHLEGALAVASVSKKADQSGSTSSSSTGEGPEFKWLQLSPKELDHHMSTVERQKELTKFLRAYEADGHTLYEAARWFPHEFAEPLAHGLPTLFGSTADRKFLAGLCLFCGKNVEEGYGIVYRIIEGFGLPAYAIYEAVAIALVKSGRVSEVAQLLNCIHSSGISDPLVVCDSVIMSCFKELPSQPNASDVDFLARNISDQNVKIKALIKCGQLKSAYLLAVKCERLDDIELILQEAEKLGQTAIQKICLKRLGRQ